MVVLRGVPVRYVTVQVWFLGTVTHNFNEIREEIFNVGSESKQTFDLTVIPGNIEPVDAQVIVEFNNVSGRRQLVPPHISYYQVKTVNNAASCTFSINNRNSYPPNTFNLDNIRVHNNGKTLLPGFDFVLNSNENSVSIYPSKVKVGDVIAIIGLIPGEYDYHIVGNKMYVPMKSQEGVTNASIKIITFTEHDSMLMRTEKFVRNVINRYQISRPVLNLSYVWVSVNGIPLKNLLEYDILDDQVTIQLLDHVITRPGDEIVIRSFSSVDLAGAVLGYRIFSDILGRTHYKRLSKENTTFLTKSLNFYDTEIQVSNPSVLTPPNRLKNIPGVILVDGERIEFLEVVGNTLRKLRRGTLGTSPSLYSEINTKVIDQSPVQTIPYSDVINKQVIYTTSSINTYVLSTVTTGVSCQSIKFSGTNNQDAVNQILVFYGGRQLAKVGTFVQDTEISYDNVPMSTPVTLNSVSEFPDNASIGDSYIVEDTNQVWIYENSTEKSAVNGFMYRGLHYKEPEFLVNTTNNSITLNIDGGVQDNIELLVVQKSYSINTEWNNTGTSLLQSTTLPAKFLQDRPSEIPDKWYYGSDGDGYLIIESREKLTDLDGNPLRGL
jgi:hypothetical protein